MSVETSNAPQRIWREWCGCATSCQLYEHTTAPSGAAGAVEYLRRDLVVPTIREVEAAIADLSTSDLYPAEVSEVACAIRVWLLSRIEGDTDEQ